MNLIPACEMHDAHPFDCLSELQKYAVSGHRVAFRGGHNDPRPACSGPEEPDGAYTV